MGHPKFDVVFVGHAQKTKSFDYASIIDALETRNFFLVDGPEIYECYVEDVTST
jgi:hypothetical protein